MMTSRPDIFTIDEKKILLTALRDHLDSLRWDRDQYKGYPNIMRATEKRIADVKILITKVREEL